MAAKSENPNGPQHEAEQEIDHYKFWILNRMGSGGRSIPEDNSMSVRVRKRPSGWTSSATPSRKTAAPSSFPIVI